jgi:hypothetical protein
VVEQYSIGTNLDIAVVVIKIYMLLKCEMQSLNQYRLRIKGKSALSEYRGFVFGDIAYKELNYLSTDWSKALRKLTPFFFNLAIANQVLALSVKSLKEVGIK